MLRRFAASSAQISWSNQVFLHQQRRIAVQLAEYTGTAVILHDTKQMPDSLFGVFPNL